MEKSNLLLTLLIISTLILSCSSDDNNIPQEPNPSEAKLVKTERVSNDFKVDYTYNSNNLLSNTVGLRPNSNFQIELIYDSSENLIENNFEETGSGNFSSSTIYEYDTNDQLIGYDEVNLSYNGNIITANGTIEGNQNATVILERNGNGLIIKMTENNSYTTFEYDTNGNLITANKFSNSDMLLNSFGINYDQNINPFFGQFESVYVERFLEFFYPFEGIFIGGFEGYSFPYLKNNIVSISENSNIISTTSYNYDNDNYPISVTQNSSGDTFQFDIVYVE